MFRDDFVQSHETAKAERQKLLADLWKMRTEMAELLRETLPASESFHAALEDTGNIRHAVESGYLGALAKHGYVHNDSEHISHGSLCRRGGARVWTLSWLVRDGVGVNRTREVPVAGEQYHRVALQIEVDPESKRIDTMFFGLDVVDGEESEFDDREKLHITWEWTSADEQLRLVYLGEGTNEPYDGDHSDRGRTTLSGRPRFFIFDRDRNSLLAYSVNWRDLGEFDWNWNFVPTVVSKTTREVQFVQFGDGRRFCLSDREVVAAASGLTREMLIEKARQINGGVLSDEDISNTLSTYRRLSARITRSEEPLTPRTQEPDVHSVLEGEGYDYVAYFTAFSPLAGVAEDPASAKKHARRLRGTRAQEYMAIFDRPVHEVFGDDAARQLPATMGALLDMPLEGVSEDVAEAVRRWRDGQADEIAKDFYYYGEPPHVRFNALRLGVYLAISEQHGGMYDRILEQARRLIEGQSVTGRYDVALIPRE